MPVNVQCHFTPLKIGQPFNAVPRLIKVRRLAHCTMSVVMEVLRVSRIVAGEHGGHLMMMMADLGRWVRVVHFGRRRTRLRRTIGARRRRRGFCGRTATCGRRQLRGGAVDAICGGRHVTRRSAIHVAVAATEVGVTM